MSDNHSAPQWSSGESEAGAHVIIGQLLVLPLATATAAAFAHFLQRFCRLPQLLHNGFQPAGDLAQFIEDLLVRGGSCARGKCAWEEGGRGACMQAARLKKTG